MSSSSKQAVPANWDSTSMQQLVLVQLREQGEAAARAGRLAEAEQYYQRALALDADNADLWVLLGTVVQSKEARAACARQALALHPDHHLAQSLLADETPPPIDPGNGRTAGPRLSPSPAILEKVPDPLPVAADLGASRASSLDPALEVSSPEPVFRPATPRLQPVSPRPRAIRLPTWPKFSWPWPQPRPRPAARPLVIALPRPRAWPRLEFTPLLRARLAAALVLLLVLAANVALAASYEGKYAGRIVPGVRIAGLDVSGLSSAEADLILQSQVAATLRRPIRLEFAGQGWTFSAAEIGLRYLTAEAVQAAEELGHRSSPWGPWRERVAASFGGFDVPLEVEAQAAGLRAVLGRVSADVDRPAIPPAVSWQEGNWVIAPGRDGRHIVSEETQERLLIALATLVNGDAPAGDTPLVVTVPVVTESAALAEADVTRLRHELDLAAQPLTMRCAERTWELGTSDIAAWLRVKLAPPEVEISVETVRTFLAGLAPQVEVPVLLPRMEVNEGRVTVFQLGSDGRRLDVDTSLARLQDVLQRRLQGRPVEAVDLPTQVVSAGQDDLMAELGVMELIGEGHSSFSGSSWARVTNIVVGGRELNGRLVAPGAEVSLNTVLDPITAEKGYVMSEIISGGEVGWGMGGGLCQVATTLYRAVLHTGLEVVERHAHAWRLGWYEQDSPPGFDATIMIGGPDLKFRNNTGHYLLIQTETSAEGSWQKVLIYGTSPGWDVTISEPARDENGLYFRRTVTKDGQVLIDETVYSNY